jgi:hypothetical protein
LRVFLRYIWTAVIQTAVVERVAWSLTYTKMDISNGDDGPDPGMLQDFKDSIGGAGGGVATSAAPLARFLCKHFGVKDVSRIEPFGNATYAWELMRESHIKVEVGSVLKNTGEEDIPLYRCDILDKNSAEDQVISCKLDSESKWCRYLDPQEPKKPFEHPNTGEPMEHSMERVCIYNVVVRHRISSVPIQVAVRMNYNHTGLDDTEATNDHDQLYKDAGGIKGEFMEIPTTTNDGQDVRYIPTHTSGYGYTNLEFVRTMALVNVDNLMNGIVPVPHDVCVEAGLSVFKGYPEPSERDLSLFMKGLSVDDGEVTEKRDAFITAFKRDMEAHHTLQGDLTIDHYYAIPINHVLAWGLHSVEYAKAKNIKREEFRYKARGGGDPVLLFFLVGNPIFDTMVSTFKDKWMNKVDVRPLKDVAFEFIPKLHGDYPNIPEDTTHVGGVLRIRAHIDFMSAPANLSSGTIASLAPALSLGFPSCQDWSIDENVRQMAIEQHMARELEERVRQKQNKKRNGK